MLTYAHMLTYAYEQVLDERAGDDELDDDKDKQDDKYQPHYLNPLSVYPA